MTVAMDQAGYYLNLCASIGRDLLVELRDAEGVQEPDSVLIKQLVGGDAEAFAAKLDDPAELERFETALRTQFDLLASLTRLVEKSEDELEGGAIELQSFGPTELMQLVPFALLAVTVFSLLFSFKAGPGGVSISVPNNELMKRLIDKNSISSLVSAFRQQSATPPAPADTDT